ncbi:MAG: hypothetical protein ABSD98_02485 [Candidatus Korobacteraceae bacterium]
MVTAYHFFDYRSNGGKAGMTAQCLMEWAKALGLPLLAVAVSGASVLAVSVFSWWQVRIAREKLRHDLHDRRFADDVETELRKANAARAHSPFLLKALGVYLEGLLKEAFRINATVKLLRDPNWTQCQTPAQIDQQASQLSSDKLNFADRMAKLVEKFEHFLTLRDFSKPTRT